MTDKELNVIKIDFLKDQKTILEIKISSLEDEIEDLSNKIYELKNETNRKVTKNNE